jgi:hypothetical protein
MRHTDPGTKRRSTPNRNANHVQYISEREHVLIAAKEESHVKYIGEREHAALTERQNGLFGKIGGEYSESYDTGDVQKYVREMSTTHRNIYWSVYSFTTETADEAGLKTLKDWEDWVKLRTYEIANHMKIKYDNLEYIAAVHLKEGQPHVHVGFWDKSQEIYRKKISPVICDKIRIDAIKHTFRDKFNELHNKEDELMKEMRRKAKEEISYGNSRYFPELRKMLGELKSVIPPKGRCSYRYMPEEVKCKIDEITTYMVDKSDAISDLYCELFETRELYNDILHNGDSEWGHYQKELYLGKLEDEIINKIGNTILRTVVDLRRNDYNPARQNSQNNEASALDIAMATADLLNSMLDYDDEQLSRCARNVFGKGDLSKEAIRELLYETGHSLER